MADAGATNRDQRATEYLEAARSLISELDRAILAICSNGLADFEESLSEQKILTARLAGLREQLWGRAKLQSLGAHLAIDRELAKEIGIAHVELQGANRIYEAVLAHSSRSASLMTSLLNSFKGQFQEASGPRLKYQTWSCQM